MLRRCPLSKLTPVSPLVQWLEMHLTLVRDDGLVVALDGGFDDSDGGVAGIVDVDSVENVGPTGGSIYDRQHRALCRHFRVVERVEIKLVFGRRMGTKVIVASLRFWTSCFALINKALSHT